MKMTKKGWWRRGGQWCQYKCLWYLHLYLYLSVYLYLCVYLYNLYGCVYFYISNSLLITMILSGVSINASGQIWQVSCYLHWPQSNHSVYYIAFANTTHCVLCSVCSSHKRLCWPQPNHNTLNMHHCNHSVHNITQCVQYHSVQEPHYHSVTVYYSRPNTCTLIWSQHLPSAPPPQKTGRIIFLR